jgi:centractin
VPYILPDGNIIELSYERNRAPEILFSPEKIGLECLSIPQLLINSINKTDIDLRKTFFSEIVLAGGGTMINNFPDRLLTECRKITSKDIKIKLYAPKERDLLCWMGGSIFCNLGSFKNMWIMK